MGFIREYAAAGDPFKFRLPKFVRKFQPGRALARVARVAAPFLPGVGGIAAQFIPDEGGGGECGDPEGFARAYGWDMGDPGPRAKKVPKRKAAAAGPKHKAARKRDARAVKSMSVGGILKKNLKGALKQTGGLVGSFVKGGYAQAGLDYLQERLGGGGQAPAGVVDFGTPGFAPGPTMRGARVPRINPYTGQPMRARRSINVTNVKALRRSMRRVEGFGKLARRVLPHLGLHVSRTHTAPTRARGKVPGSWRGKRAS